MDPYVGNYQLSPRWRVQMSAGQATFASEHVELRLPGALSSQDLVDQISAGAFELGAVNSQVATALLQRNVIVPEFEEPVRPALDRQARYWSAFDRNDSRALRRLGDAHVLVFGVGGIGCVVAEVLAASGVRRFTLIDPDQVAWSNLNRQFLYRADDVGEPKVHAAKGALLARHSDLEIATHRGAYPAFGVDEIRKVAPDFVVVAFDAPSITAPADLLQELWNASVPSAFAATGFDKTYASPIFDSERSKVSPADFLVATTESRERRPIAASSGASNAYAAALLSEQILLHLAGAHDEVEYRSGLVTSRRRGYPHFTSMDRLRL